ncbi:hypothetical protein HMPREF9144_0341 [Prevotella pallens ATCC 700821]|uniref:Uncharacterized protein n=1 Tax=Prevotella pallens ATCC 700821 TaxID=997353 RepID=F9DFA1_9BACT|nr:hypothetical protein HMPREF9144_0341 [Prevotella pallens ATCC 700821]
MAVLKQLEKYTIWYFLTCYNILLIVLALLLHRIRLKDCKNGIRTF